MEVKKEKQIDEEAIIEKWRDEGFLTLDPELKISKEFWDFTSEILYKGYVLRDKE